MDDFNRPRQFYAEGDARRQPPANQSGAHFSQEPRQPRFEGFGQYASSHPVRPASSGPIAPRAVPRAPPAPVISDRRPSAPLASAYSHGVDESDRAGPNRGGWDSQPATRFDREMGPQGPHRDRPQSSGPPAGSMPSPAVIYVAGEQMACASYKQITHVGAICHLADDEAGRDSSSGNAAGDKPRTKELKFSRSARPEKFVEAFATNPDALEHLGFRLHTTKGLVSCHTNNGSTCSVEELLLDFLAFVAECRGGGDNSRVDGNTPKAILVFFSDPFERCQVNHFLTSLFSHLSHFGLKEVFLEEVGNCVDLCTVSRQLGLLDERTDSRLSHLYRRVLRTPCPLDRGFFPCDVVASVMAVVVHAMEKLVGDTDGTELDHLVRGHARRAPRDLRYRAEQAPEWPDLRLKWMDRCLITQNWQPTANKEVRLGTYFKIGHMEEPTWVKVYFDQRSDEWLGVRNVDSNSEEGELLEPTPVLGTSKRAHRGRKRKQDRALAPKADTISLEKLDASSEGGAKKVENWLVTAAGASAERAPTPEANNCSDSRDNHETVDMETVSIASSADQLERNRRRQAGGQSPSTRNSDQTETSDSQSSTSSTSTDKSDREGDEWWVNATDRFLKRLDGIAAVKPVAGSEAVRVLDRSCRNCTEEKMLADVWPPQPCSECPKFDVTLVTSNFLNDRGRSRDDDGLLLGRIEWKAQDVNLGGIARVKFFGHGAFSCMRQVAEIFGGKFILIKDANTSSALGQVLSRKSATNIGVCQVLNDCDPALSSERCGAFYSAFNAKMGILTGTRFSLTTQVQKPSPSEVCTKIGHVQRIICKHLPELHPFDAFTCLAPVMTHAMALKETHDIKAMMVALNKVAGIKVFTLRCCSLLDAAKSLDLSLPNLKPTPDYLEDSECLPDFLSLRRVNYAFIEAGLSKWSFSLFPQDSLHPLGTSQNDVSKAYSKVHQKEYNKLFLPWTPDEHSFESCSRLLERHEMCQGCPQYVLSTLHDSLVPRGESRTIVCRVVPSGRTDISKDTKRLMLFPALEDLQEIDLICKVLHVGQDAYCVATIRLYDGKGDASSKFQRIPAGLAIAVGIEKKVPVSDDDKKPPPPPIPIKLAKPLRVPTDGSVTDAYVTPSDSKDLTHTPVLVTLGKVSPRVSLASLGVPYLQGGKMTKIQVRVSNQQLGRGKLPTQAPIDFEKGCEFGEGHRLDVEKNLWRFLNYKCRRHLMRPTAPICRRVFHELAFADEASAAEAAPSTRVISVNVDPPVPPRMHCDKEGAFQVYVSESHAPSYRIVLATAIEESKGWRVDPLDRLSVKVEKTTSNSEVTLSQAPVGILEVRDYLSSTVKLFVLPLLAVVRPHPLLPGRFCELECCITLLQHEDRIPKLESGTIWPHSGGDIRVVSRSDSEGRPLPLEEFGFQESSGRDQTLGQFTLSVENASISRVFRAGERVYLGYAKIVVRFAYPPLEEKRLLDHHQSTTPDLINDLTEVALHPEKASKGGGDFVPRKKKLNRSYDSHKLTKGAEENKPKDAECGLTGPSSGLKGKKKKRTSRGKGRKILPKS